MRDVEVDVGNGFGINLGSSGANAKATDKAGLQNLS
jgi:hypothetical protein